MAHWAELDENNFVMRVTVGSNDELDEGCQWLIDNLGGRWIKTSYNTRGGKHITGGVPLRYNFAGTGMYYDEENDAFIDVSPYPSWILNKTTFLWEAPFKAPDAGGWSWNEEEKQWVEI